jgi:hypothetical protein
MKSQTPRRIMPRLLSVFLILAVIQVSAGCRRCSMELQKAQDMFNAAYQGQAAGAASAPQQAKYQQVIDQVEQKTLPCLTRDDLKVQAYAMEAYAKFSLGKYTEAIADAQKGQDLYERAGKVTNPRDYGLLLIVPGYAIYSQTYDRYQERRKQGFLSKEEAQKFTQDMAKALQQIDTVNAKLDKNDEMVILANQIVRQIMLMWDTDVKDRKEAEPQVRLWAAKADDIARKFPAGDYPFKSETQSLLKKIDSLKKAYDVK